MARAKTSSKQAAAAKRAKGAKAAGTDYIGPSNVTGGGGCAQPPANQRAGRKC